MITGVIGVGDMGLPMAGHIAAAGLDVLAFDLDEDRLAAAGERGVIPADSLAELASKVDLYIACLRDDQQMRTVGCELAELGRPGQLVVVAGTHGVAFMAELGELLARRDLQVIDAPVVFGAEGAREGTLLSLCGGDKSDVDRARPILMCYSRAVEHVGPLGAGQLTKTVNNLLHWVHAVSNFEALAIAKRYGVDAQRMREVLLNCPADNGTLRRWDTSRFTWQEKDMDLVMDLAQTGGLVLPLTGQVDQLVKTMHADDVAALLYGQECQYLGRRITPLAKADGGL